MEKDSLEENKVESLHYLDTNNNRQSYVWYIKEDSVVIMFSRTHSRFHQHDSNKKRKVEG